VKQSHGVLPLTNAYQDVQKKIATTLQYSTICSNIFMPLLMKRGRSVSLTFSFPIKSTRTPWPTFLRLCSHIRPGQQRNPIDCGVIGSKVKVTQVKCTKTV